MSSATGQPPRRPSYHSRWIAPFAWVEWSFEWVVYWFSKLAIFQVLEYVGRLTVLVAVIFYFLEAPERQKQSHYQAWQVINSAQGQRTSGGRIDALQDLNRDNVSLDGLVADHAYLLSISLPNASLSNADLQGATLADANLQEAILRSADLQGAFLSNANLQGAFLSSADLQGADLYSADLQGATLADANLQGAHLSNANLQGADLSDANLQGAHLYSADLQGAFLSNADLQGADLSNADLQGAFLSNANLQGADLSNADLQGVRNITIDQIKTAYNWEQAIYDDDFQAQLGLPPNPTTSPASPTATSTSTP